MAWPTSGRARSRRGRVWPSCATRPTDSWLPVVDGTDATRTPLGAEIPVERYAVAVVVIGGGSAGQRAVADAEAAGRDVLLLDAEDGREVVAIYPGPTVVVRTPDGMLHIDAGEIVVATGAAEIQPVCPGNDLAGILTPAQRNACMPPAWTSGRRSSLGRLRSACLRTRSMAPWFASKAMAGRLTAVVTADPLTGWRRRRPVGPRSSGWGAPRDLLARMAGPSVPVRAVGPAAGKRAAAAPSGLRRRLPLHGRDRRQPR